MRYRCSRITAGLITIGLLALASCSDTPTTPTPGITRAQAVDIARAQATFEPTSIDARTDVRQGTSVWIVTLRAADGSHGGLGQFMEVTMDRSNGTVLSIARS